MDLTLLQDITFHDDTFSLERELEQAEATPRGRRELPPPGFYRVQLLDCEAKVSKTKGTPGFKIMKLAVLEPSEYASDRPFPLFQDVWCVSFQMKDKNGAPMKDAKGNPMMKREYFDLLMAIDKSAAQPEPAENIRELARLLSTNPIITARLSYEATDKAYVESLLGTGVEKTAAYKQARVTSRAFRLPDGTYAQETVGPSGQLVPAGLKIAEFVREGREVELGALKPRR